MDISQLDDPIDILVANAFSPATLSSFQAELILQAGLIKRRKETFDALMVRLYGDKARLAYQIAKKDTGVVHIAASNTLNLTVDVDKDVKWDQTILRAALDAMTPDDARHYGKVAITVEEKKYTAAPPAIQTALQCARTVKPGKMKFTFAEVEVA